MILLLGALAVAVAAVLGGVVGFSYALVALPLLLLVGVALPDVVVTNLLIGLVTRLGVLVRYHRQVDRVRVLPLLAGCALGLLIAVLVRDSIPARTSQALAVVAVMVSTVWVLRPGRPVRAGRSAVAGAWLLAVTGVGSGFLTLATSLGGLLPAAVLSRSASNGRAFRAEMAAVLVVGNAMALAVLLTAPGTTDSQLTATVLGIWLLVGVVANVAGNALADRIPQPVFRRVVTVVVLGSGAAVLISTLLR